MIQEKSSIYEKVPIAEKYALTVEQMAEYTNIGTKKLYSIIQEHKYGNFVLNIGNKKLLKRVAFTKFLDEATTI